MNTPLVSICIPTYNRPELLLRAVRSCLRQTCNDFEIIITDNSPNDDTKTQIGRSFGQEPRVRYYSNGGNIGPTASCLRLVSLAHGKYVLLLMDDDLLKPLFLERTVAALEEHPSAGIAAAPMEIIDEDDKRIFPRFYLFRKMKYRYRYQSGSGLVARKRVLRDFLTRDYPFCVSSGFLFRAEALQEALPFDPAAGFAGDLLTSLKIVQKWDVYYIDEVLSSWRHTPACHTATLHRAGLDERAFYYVARRCLDSAATRLMFNDEWDKLVRDTMFFCSCRALLNVASGVKSGRPGLIFKTVKTIFKEDRCVWNWLRLPLFVLREVLASMLPGAASPPRETIGAGNVTQEMTVDSANSRNASVL